MTSESSSHNDPDYNPDNSEEEATNSPLIIYVPAPPSIRTRPPPAKRARFESGLSKEERDYFARLTAEQKQQLVSNDEQARNTNAITTNAVPLRFRILNADITPSAKRILLSKLDHVQSMNPGASEYFKLRTWIQAATRLPLGRYHQLPVRAGDPTPKIAEFVTHLRKTLDDTVYGHKETKDHVIRTFAQWISNPSSKGNVIGIHGPMGCGKTSLVKDGICKALNMPFGFVALGGASDASFLDGHSFTYEGSTYGKICEVLMKAGVMNPVLFFDELDKISQSHRGEEVAGVLMHLTDSSQNETFCDKYFAELELDLSKALIVFSYNDASLVNPILLDRMVTIEVNGYSAKDKIVIAQRHLIPSLLEQFGFAPGDIVFSKEMIESIIQRVAAEDGVRNLKRGLEAVISWVNISRYTSTETVTLPFRVTRDHVNTCVKMVAEPQSMLSMYM